MRPLQKCQDALWRIFRLCMEKKKMAVLVSGFPALFWLWGRQPSRSAVKTTQPTGAFEVETLLAVDQKVKCINKHYSHSHFESC